MVSAAALAAGGAARRALTHNTRDRYYPPRNDDHTAEEGERPPLLVKIHGGPTSAASPLFNLTIQFWTSRGFAVADVDFGGSTGYGRDYRYALEHQWGVVDVEDAASAAAFLAEQGLADPKKLAIDGGSAGGFTTLAALTFTDTFTAGCCCYGISDLEILAADTHKVCVHNLTNKPHDPPTDPKKKMFPTN